VDQKNGTILIFCK